MSPEAKTPYTGTSGKDPPENAAATMAEGGGDRLRV